MRFARAAGRDATATAAVVRASGLHRVLTGEEAKAMGKEIARAAGRPEAQSAGPRPGHIQPSDEPSRGPHRDELSGT